ncbi:MAG: FAD-dependent oxidoreductase [Verrucomicrobia bacterium]|nr:FAD-dependent oxidoreductase [Verrucomicrobiota bacterium]
MPARTPVFRHLRRLLGIGLSREPVPSGRVSRRRFLQTSTGAAAALSTPSRATEPFKGSVAIIGGGLAGLTAAWHLRQSEATVELFEASPRLGGRVFTKRNFNSDGMFVELGGELIDTNHTALIQLARDLGLQLQHLVEGEAGKDRLWFEDRARSEEEWLAGLQPVITRIAGDVAKLYHDDGSFTPYAAQLDRISLIGYLAGIPGVEPWISDYLLAAYEPEYGLSASLISCLNLVDFTDTDLRDGYSVFGDSDEAWRIMGGNSRLPDTLTHQLKDRVTCHTGKRLIGIVLQDHRVQLSFAGEESARGFDKVIVTLPFNQLRKVTGFFDLPVSQEKARAVRELGYGQNIKVMRGFSSRVWRQQGSNGSVFAELPNFQNIWETSRGQEGTGGILTNLLGGRRATEFQVRADERDLTDIDTVFPGAKTAYDGNSAVMNWPKVPTHEGSYSCPLTGQYTWINAASARPECEGRLLFAGEHTSEAFCGFMNGAVESGRRAARETMG